MQQTYTFKTILDAGYLMLDRQYAILKVFTTAGSIRYQVSSIGIRPFVNRLQTKISLTNPSVK